MSDKNRLISREELSSFHKAFWGCPSWALKDGVFAGEANGWKMVLGKDEESSKYIAYAISGDLGVDVQFSPRLSEDLYNTIKKKHEGQS